MTDTYAWRPYHEWTPLKSTQIDGRIERPNSTMVPVDVWAEDDEDAGIELLRGCSAAWRVGGVRFELVGGLFNLIVPAPVLTEDLVHMALQRFCLLAFGVDGLVVEDATTS